MGKFGKFPLLVTDNDQLCIVTLDRLIDHHPENGVGFIKVGTDGQDCITLFNLGIGTSRSGNPEGLS